MATRRRSTPTTSVVLLRGINVGGKRKLSMASLRAICADAGCDAVETYIQSGNVMLRSAMTESALVAELEQRIADHAGFDVPVVVRTAEQLASVVDRCPFDTSVDPMTLVVSFVQTRPAGDVLPGLDPDGFGEERFALDGRELYLCLPDGQGRSKLAQAVARTPFGLAATARNWKTVRTLLDLTRKTQTAST